MLNGRAADSVCANVYATMPAMPELEDTIRTIIDRYALLIRKIIQAHLFARDGVDPEDIEQEIRIRLWKSLRKGKNIGQLTSYIKKMAYTATIDELRRQKKQAPYRETLPGDGRLEQVDEAAGVQDPSSPASALEQKETRRALKELLADLSLDRRQVLNLYLVGMSIDEICATSGWDRTRVRHLLYRGIDELRAKAGAGFRLGKPGLEPRTFGE